MPKPEKHNTGQQKTIFGATDVSIEFI